MSKAKKKRTIRRSPVAAVSTLPAGDWIPVVEPVQSSRWEALTRLESLHSEVSQAIGARDQAVSDARASGATWVDVGEILGITRQAARQRFGSTD